MFFSAASLAGAFSGLLAAAILKMDGIQGKPGWAWIFLLVNRGRVVFHIEYIVSVSSAYRSTTFHREIWT